MGPANQRVHPPSAEPFSQPPNSKTLNISSRGSIGGLEGVWRGWRRLILFATDEARLTTNADKVVLWCCGAVVRWCCGDRFLLAAPPLASRKGKEATEEAVGSLPPGPPPGGVIPTAGGGSAPPVVGPRGVLKTAVGSLPPPPLGPPPAGGVRIPTAPGGSAPPVGIRLIVGPRGVL
eukprot:1195813-Prorocentrum_minimum.AAC.6